MSSTYANLYIVVHTDLTTCKIDFANKQMLQGKFFLGVLAIEVSILRVAHLASRIHTSATGNTECFRPFLLPPGFEVRRQLDHSDRFFFS